MKLLEIASAVDWNNLTIKNEARQESYTGMLDNLLPVVFLVAGILAFIYIVYSGFIYITAGGNPDATKKGQQGILNGIIGLIIVFASYGIVFAVVNFLNTRSQ